MTVTASTKGRFRPRYHTSPVTYRVLRAVTTFLMHILYRWDIQGRENVPPEGATMVVVNHLHLLDPFAVAPQFSRQIVTMAADKWRDNWFVGTILRWAGAIFIRRGEVDREALKDSMEVLNAGKVLAIAPEGTRSRTGGLQEGKAGVAYLAMRSNAIIVPVAFWGIEKLRTWRPFHPPTCHVRVGRPFRLPRPEGRLSTERLRELADLVMIEIGCLLPENYRGIYAQRVEDYLAGRYQGPRPLPV